MDGARPDESLRPALEALAARDSDLAGAYASCGLPPVRGDEDKLALLLANVISKAIKFTHAGGRVAIEAQRT